MMDKTVDDGSVPSWPIGYFIEHAVTIGRVSWNLLRVSGCCVAVEFVPFGCYGTFCV